ncbi:MAG: tRNA (adenosine(37)-N6)-threonylcarbamoyltransferase complex ATPase subunit type 1 TsaE [Planctomycetota bacterium]
MFDRRVTRSFDSIDAAHLDRFAVAMVKTMPLRLTLGMVGTLGAGKTTLTQHIAAAAGVDREFVTSPTFSLRCTYQASVRGTSIMLHHMDAYRVADEDEFLALGVEEHLESEFTWNLIEWADRVSEVLPDDTLWLNIEPLPGQGDLESAPRRLTFASDAPSMLKTLSELELQFES